MPKHTHAEHYLSNPYELVPSVGIIHPDVQRSPPPDAEHYLLPAVFEVRNGDKFIGKYPGPGVYYITEGELEYEDKKNPGHVVKIGAGSVLHIEEGDTLEWYSPSSVKGFAVFWVPVSIKGFEAFLVPDSE